MSTTLGKGGRFLREVVADSSHGVFVIDPSGAVVFSNGVLEDCLGVESGDVLEERIGDLAAGDVLDRVRDAAAASPGEVVEFELRDVDGDRVRMGATCETTEFEGTRYITLWCQERRLGLDCGTAGSAGETARRDVAVDELTGVWRDLLRAESPSEAAEVGLAAVERFLGVEVACVRLVDGESNALERAATTERAAALLASEPVFDLNRSLAGRAFRRGEPVLDRPEGGGDLARENLHVPLDGQGTLSVFGTGTGLSAGDVDVAEDLASVIAAGIERARAGPAAGGAAFELPVREVVAAAIEGESRDSIGRRVCERFAATGSFDGAWFVETDVDGAWRAVEASAGDTDSPPEGVRRAAADTTGGDDPVRRAVETGDVCLVRRRRTVRNGDGHGTSGDESVETAVVVPVTHGDRTYGVLVLRAGSEEVDPVARSELALLGNVVGLAVYAAQSKKLLLSERVQQLEFEVTDPSCLAVAVSEATDAFCEVEHRTLTNDGDHLCYLQVEGAPPEEARRATADLGTVTDCRVVDTGEGECLLEAVKTQSGAEAMMEVGATVRRATADGGVGTLVVETPLSADVREVVDAYTARNPDSHLVAKREIDRSVPAAGALATSLDDVLTDRQQSVLTAAYYAGYFEWPRANTAEEVADSLGISPATLHQHLRTAERKLLDLVCEEQSHLR